MSPMMKHTPMPVFAVATMAGPAARAEAFPAGAGHDTVTAACTQCHDSDAITGQRLSRDGWTDTVGRMIANGAQISDADQPKIVDYLAKNFPAK